MSNIGSVIVVCPQCGRSLEAPIEIWDVAIKPTYLYVRFNGVVIDHKCEG